MTLHPLNPNRTDSEIFLKRFSSGARLHSRLVISTIAISLSVSNAICYSEELISGQGFGESLRIETRTSHVSDKTNELISRTCTIECRAQSCCDWSLETSLSQETEASNCTCIERNFWTRLCMQKMQFAVSIRVWLKTTSSRTPSKWSAFH